MEPAWMPHMAKPQRRDESPRRAQPPFPATDSRSNPMQYSFTGAALAVDGGYTAC